MTHDIIKYGVGCQCKL